MASTHTESFPMKSILLEWKIWLLASLTLGLAPFFPEPHIWEKIRWLATGQFPWEGIYIFDLFLHGSPWVMLGISVGLNLRKHKDRQD
jgi:hypothetical protein